MIARRALGRRPSAAVRHQTAAEAHRTCSSAPQVRISAVSSVAVLVLRAITRAISLSALVGRTVTGMLPNLLSERAPADCILTHPLALWFRLQRIFRYR